MRPSAVLSGLVAVLIGFGGSVAIVLEAAAAVGASPAQTSSWIAVLCLSMMVSTAVLSVFHRLPIVTSWSTPGAALIAGTSGLGMEAAVGSFLLAAALILVTAFLRPLAALTTRIPAEVAAAMLAGVLFSFVVAPFGHIEATPELVLPMLVGFVALRLISPIWAVIAVLVVGVGLSYALDLADPVARLSLSRFIWVTPSFDAAALIGVGIPLYLVSMASQNLPGFAVLRSAGYPVPTRSILTVTGLMSLLTAGFCGHTTTLAAITAAICAGPEAHPDKTKRWQTGIYYAIGYAALAAVGASIVALFTQFPPALVATLAGLALLGPFMGALATGLGSGRDAFPAALTFVVTASGFSAFGIGAAFWGLVAGLLAVGIGRLRGAT